MRLITKFYILCVSPHSIHERQISYVFWGTYFHASAVSAYVVRWSYIMFLSASILSTLTLSNVICLSLCIITQHAYKLNRRTLSELYTKRWMDKLVWIIVCYTNSTIACSRVTKSQNRLCLIHLIARIILRTCKTIFMHTGSTQ